MKRHITFFLCLFVVIAQQVQAQNDEEMMITRDLVKPPSLKKGDTIIILAPAGKIKDRSAVDAGIELANHWGLVVFFGNHLLSEDNTFAGTDEERLSDLQKALDDPSIKAIWAARGGYGTVRIIDDLDFSGFAENPKWIIGYSDITVLHNKLHDLGYQSVHGQMPVTLELEDPIQKESIHSLYRALFGKKMQYKIPSSKFNRMGKSTGQLVGGNLSIVYSMLASDTNLNMQGKILFIEDVGEALYHIDRMMVSLKRAGYFKGCKGIVVGDFKLKPNESNPFGKSLEEIVLEAAEGTDFPIVFDFPAGHLDDNRSLLLGSYVDIQANKNRAKIKFE
ncbi:S66 peptidase family protein [Lutimonas zeaxanthinifaciens]|uniref:S66 peptidase family protein n=1 Tax=Lutimonas zeaxanthinifaciens TaxID=3060215 RepID=UPI00265CEC65|nr:LD-carboxypeptidase [Lutimonas sp. YSD2104]WKK65854.1 LD-carboxypeptidase [Lutimonas sp. YSD2104]